MKVREDLKAYLLLGDTAEVERRQPSPRPPGSITRIRTQTLTGLPPGACRDRWPFRNADFPLRILRAIQNLLFTAGVTTWPWPFQSKAKTGGVFSALVGINLAAGPASRGPHRRICSGMSS